MASRSEIKYMSQVDDILKKFDEFETSMKTHLAKVDPRLIVDLLLLQKKEPSNKNPIYTLEVFIKPNQNTDEIRNRIIKETGMVPAFYDGGTHIVVAHKINFDMLKMINDIETVERIRGTYSGGGMASIGPVYD
jgi:hypothetical protein